MPVRDDEVPSPSLPSTARPDEVERFGRLAQRWWDPDGPMKVLLRMNPVRLGWLDGHVRRRLGSARADGTALRVLDVGCGAGIAAEGLAAMGYAVMGVDASAEAVAAARRHAAASGIGNGLLRYAVGTAEALPAEEAGFDVVTAFEVVEHAAEPGSFLRALAGRVRPGGLVALTTVNRTARSLMFAKIGAEYVAGLLPRGTHRWRRFPTPGELARAGRDAGLGVLDVAGMVPDPRRGPGAWRMAADPATNYAMLLQA